MNEKKDEDYDPDYEVFPEEKNKPEEKKESIINTKLVGKNRTRKK